ncbi:MAG TPA: TraC family protein, partial [Dissulfurispiraceae bacterium]|nr:TraC family protein [Dissulfurispiraceae bacterium]
MMTPSSISTEKKSADPGLDDVRFDTVEEVNRSFTTLPSFGSMLPYRSFDEQYKMFILGDSAKKERYAGAMWEYTPFVHEANSLEGQKLAIANLMETALLQIPEGYAFQFITVSDRNVGSFLPLPSKPADGTERAGPSAVDTLYNEQVMFLHESSKTGLWGGRSVFPRTMRFYITVFHVPRKITLGERSVSAIERVELESATMDICKKINVFSGNITLFESMMKNNGFSLRRCEGRDLINYFHQHLHKNMFKGGLGAPEYIPQIDLSSQLFRTFIYTSDAFVYSDGHYYRTAAATNAPQYTVPGIMYKLMEIPGDIQICLTGFVEAQDKEKGALKWKGNLASFGLMNPFGREDNDNSAIAADIDTIEKDMLAGKKVFHFSFYVTNVGETYDLANTYAQKVNSKIAELEIPMLADNIISQSIFKNCLPFHYAALDNRNHLSRTFKLPSHFFA